MPWGKLRGFLAILVMVIGAACSSTGSSPVQSPFPSLSPTGTPSAAPTQAPSTPSTTTITGGATSFVEYSDAFCSAWASMFRAVGNIENGSGSELSLALDAAMEAKDAVKAGLLAEQINGELEVGRQRVAIAGAWPPAAESMTHLDRIFVALEKMTTAHVPLALGQPGAPDPQSVLEQAGGIEAWMSFLDTYPSLNGERPSGTSTQCEGLPIGP